MNKKKLKNNYMRKDVSFKFVICSISLLFLLGCSNHKALTVKTNTNNNQSMNQTLTGQIIKKELIKANGEKSGHFDLYLRCSIQDYFIKFCESSITKEDIEALNLGQFDAISVDAEIKHGEWDVCHGLGTDVIPTRIGNYVVIYKMY